MTFVEALIQLDAAGAFPIAADTATRKSILNQAIERMLDNGRFVGTQQTLNIAINSSGVFTLPRHYSAVLGVTVNGRATDLASKWYAFLPGTDVQFTSAAIDNGSGYATFTDPTEACQVKVGAPNETGTVHIQGLDENGNQVYDDTGALGFDVTLNDTSWSAQYVTTITSVQMPVTNTLKTLTVKNQSDATQSVLGLYEPGETLGDYRRYSLPEATALNPDSLDEDSLAVVALCKRKFVTLVSNSDVVYPSSVSGLKCACMAVHFENEAAGDYSEFYANRAIKIFNNQLRSSLADSEIGRVRVYSTGSHPARALY